MASTIALSELVALGLPEVLDTVLNHLPGILESLVEVLGYYEEHGAWTFEFT